MSHTRAGPETTGNPSRSQSANNASRYPSSLLSVLWPIGSRCIGLVGFQLVVIALRRGRGRGATQLSIFLAPSCKCAWKAGRSLLSYELQTRQARHCWIPGHWTVPAASGLHGYTRGVTCSQAARQPGGNQTQAHFQATRHDARYARRANATGDLRPCATQLAYS